MKRLLGAFAAGLLLATVGACSSSDGGPEKTTITVFAAASLKGTFTEIGKKFEAEHEGVTVTFNFGGSSDLVAQLEQGAPADVFASADTATMLKAIDAGAVDGKPQNFASNSLEIATPADNPAKVRSLDDLARRSVKIVMCAAQVPCGAVAHEVEQRSGVDIKPVSEEQSVTDVLGKVISGEADAGLVYVTDIKAAGDQVHGIPIPESYGVPTTYPIAAVKIGPGAAQEFVDYVNGPKGQAVLSAAGFKGPR
jgi:molybdate transport system substrate-binding protein